MDIPEEEITNAKNEISDPTTDDNNVNTSNTSNATKEVDEAAKKDVENTEKQLEGGNTNSDGNDNQTTNDNANTDHNSEENEVEDDIKKDGDKEVVKALDKFEELGDNFTQDDINSTSQEMVGNKKGASVFKEDGKSVSNDEVENSLEKEKSPEKLVKEHTEAVDKKVKGMEKLANAEGKSMWTSAGKFGRWAVVEIGKGALMQVGIEGVLVIWNLVAAKIAQSSNSSTSPAAANGYPSPRELQIITAISTERLSTTQYTSDWTSWMAVHYNSKDSYGTVQAATAPGMSFPVDAFIILQTQVGTANGQLTQLQDGVKACTKPDGADGKKSWEDQLTDEIAYVDSLLQISNFITSDACSKMVVDGLNSHVADLAAAKNALVTVQQLKPAST